MVKYDKAKKAIEALYEGLCTIYIQEKDKDEETGETVFTETPILTNEPCRLSFASIPATDIIDHAPRLGQAVKLFLSPGADVPPGSRIVVTQNGVTNDYSMSGQPARYVTHQETSLELFKGWA